MEDIQVDPILFEEADIDNLYDFNGYLTYTDMNFLGEYQMLTRYHDVDGGVIEIGLAIIDEDESIPSAKAKSYGNLITNMGKGVTKRRAIAERIKELNKKEWNTKKELLESADVNYEYGGQIMKLFNIELNKKRRVNSGLERQR